MSDSSERLQLFERVVGENRQRIHLVAKLNAPQGSVQDLEQEILMALWQSLDRYQGKSSLATWVYAVALNTARHYARGHRRGDLQAESIPADAVETRPPQEGLDAAEILDLYLLSLDREDRNLLLMYLDEMSYAEMAQALDRDEAQLRVRVSRLKKQFRDRYDAGY